MIRLELGSRRHDLARRILLAVGLVALAVAAVGAMKWLDGRYALLESWSHLYSGQTVGPPVAPSEGAPGVSVDRGGGAASPGDEPSPQRGGERGAPQMPMRSDLCLRTVEQYGRLPASLTSFTSLKSESSGEYTFEGLRAAREVSDLFDFLHELQRLRWRPTLSYWQEGGSHGERPYEFFFRGVVGDSAAGIPLNSLTAAKASSLLDGVARRAWRSGLDSVTVTDPVGLQLTPTLVRLRPKLWATGTYDQVSTFAISLREVADELTLCQLAIVPIRSRGGSGKVQLYAALEVLVRTPSEASENAVAADAAL